MSQQAYYPGIIQYFNISLAQGTSFLVSEKECTDTLGAVLNGCPPTETTDGQPLLKYGGSLAVGDGRGNVADFMITIELDIAVA